MKLPWTGWRGSPRNWPNNFNPFLKPDDIKIVESYDESPSCLDTKYGNTKLVAETILEDIKEVEGIETAIHDIDRLKLDDLPDFDVVLIGSPNHFGRPVRGINRFIDRIGELDTGGKKSAVFDTYLGGDFKAVLKNGVENKGKSPSSQTDRTWSINKGRGYEGTYCRWRISKVQRFRK